MAKRKTATKKKAVKKSTPKKAPIKKKIIHEKDLNYNDKVLKNRDIHIFDTVDSKSMEKAIKQVLALELTEKAPIRIWINTPGGCVHSGLAFANTLRRVKSHIITIVDNQACSMGGIISVVGDTRYIASTGFWMGHDMRGGIWGDYSAKVEDRADYVKKLWNVLVKHFEKYTKLTKRDLEKLRNGELWLTAGEALEKGVADKILEGC